MRPADGRFCGLPMSDLDIVSVGSSAGIAAAVATVLTFLLELIRAPIRGAWAKWRRSSMLAASLRNLTCGVQLSYFEGVLGSRPQFVNTRGIPHEGGPHLREHIYVLPEVVVQAITKAEDSAVIAFAVTTRSRGFAPALGYYPRGGQPHPGRVILGRTRLIDIADGSAPEGILAVRGNRPWTYTESHYFGNPGHYLYYVFGCNQSGYCKNVLPQGVPPVRFGVVFGSHRTDLFAGADWLATEQGREWRSTGVINTCGVVQEPDAVFKDKGFWVGPDYDQVRLLDR